MRRCTRVKIGPPESNYHHLPWLPSSPAAAAAAGGSQAGLCLCDESNRGNRWKHSVDKWMGRSNLNCKFTPTTQYAIFREEPPPPVHCPAVAELSSKV